MSRRAHRSPRSVSRALIVVGALALVLIFGTTALALTTHPDAPAQGDRPAAAATAPAQGPVAAMAPSVPVSVAVPSIGASSSLVGLGLDDRRQMATPPLSHPEQASWYTGAPQPGTVGPAVILGHINGNGRPGVFLHLDQVRAGQGIDVERADHRAAHFTVTRTETVGKDRFPAAEVFGDTPGPELRLISCGGDLDRTRHSYESNVIVFAVLSG